MEQEYPLQWPEGHPRTQRRAKGAFRRTLTQARVHLIKQAQLAGGSNIVISSNYGGLSGKNPTDPGVAIYFNRRGQRLGMGCDTWALIEHNICALANTIENMRGIERYGCSHLMDQAFKSFETLPPPASANSPLVILGLQGTKVTAEQIESRFRQLVKKHHPDGGGSTEDFNRLQEARRKALQAIE